MPQERLPTPLTADRVILLGNTREGKSVLAKALLRAKRNVIVIDTKEREYWGDVVTNPEKYPNPDKPYVVGGVDAIKDIEGPGRYVWRPGYDFTDSMEAREEFFRWALEVGNRVIYIDEIIDVAESATKYPKWYRRCVKTGASANLGMWGTTQEPRGIPLWTVGQAQYTFAFHTGLPEYRDRIDQIMETKVPWQQLPSRSFEFVWKDQNGMHGPTHLDIKHPDAPRLTTVEAR